MFLVYTEVDSVIMLLFVRMWRLLCLSVVVLVAFTICWLPFLSNKELLIQVIHRLFPFARGLFEVHEQTTNH